MDGALVFLAEDKPSIKLNFFHGKLGENYTRVVNSGEYFTAFEATRKEQSFVVPYAVA